MAQYGYSFLVPSVALGLNQSEITDVKKLEIELLNLDIELIPLQSSHTQSSKENDSDNKSNISEKPNNEKDQDKKSDRTLENEQSKDGGGN